MSESVSAEQGVVIGELPRELSRLLGHQALGETIQVYLDRMSSAARLNAVNAMAGLITSLETVVELPVEPKINHIESKVHLASVTAVDGESALDETSHITAQDSSTELDGGDVEIGVGVNEASDIVPVLSVEAAASSVQVQPIDKKPLNYLYECFDSDVVDHLDRTHIPALADSIVTAYRTHFPKANKTGERLHTELIMYLEGKTDEGIAEAVGRSSAAAAQLARSYVFVRLKKKLTEEEFNQIASVVVESEIKPASNPEAISEPSLPTRTEQILAEHGITIDSTQETDLGDPKLLLQKGIETAFGKKMLTSLNVLLETEADAISPAAEDVRNKLTDLMQKYAPRYFPKLDITQDEWNTLANIIGFGIKPVTISNYHKKHLARFNITKTDPTNQLITSAAYLLHQFVSGAKAVAPAHKASSTSFTKGRSRR